MAFPRIDHCLICEDVRPEQNRKATILGFYGVAPNVLILVADLKKPIDQLAFLLVADRGEGRFKISMHLKDEEGKVLVNTPETELAIQDITRRNNWFFGIRRPEFPHPGRYTFSLIVNGQLNYEASFEVQQGKPEDFAT